MYIFVLSVAGKAESIWFLPDYNVFFDLTKVFHLVIKCSLIYSRNLDDNHSRLMRWITSIHEGTQVLILQNNSSSAPNQSEVKMGCVISPEYATPTLFNIFSRLFPLDFCLLVGNSASLYTRKESKLFIPKHLHEKKYFPQQGPNTLTLHSRNLLQYFVICLALLCRDWISTPRRSKPRLSTFSLSSLEITI